MVLARVRDRSGMATLGAIRADSPTAPTDHREGGGGTPKKPSKSIWGVPVR